MTTTTLNARHLAPATPGVGAAMHELLEACRHLIAALWVKATQRSATLSQALTAAQEADNLRSMAAGLMQQDPRFANELFAAADRHEYLAALR